MTSLTRRRSLTLLAGMSGAGAFGGFSAEAATKTFVAFGDSYTRSYRSGIASWADQINASGEARMLVDLAVSGSFAVGSNAATTLDGQIDRWIVSYKSRGRARPHSGLHGQQRCGFFAFAQQFDDAVSRSG